MVPMATTSQSAASSQSDLQGEFRADPGAHLPMILVCAVIALLCAAGVVWLVIKPGAIDVGRVLTAIVLMLLAVVCVGVAGYFWMRLRRTIGLSATGLTYFDGRQAHVIAWRDVQDVYEEVSSVKLLGITVDSPKLGVALVTNSGVRCEIDQNLSGYETLGPLVSREAGREVRQRVKSQFAAHQGAQFGPLTVSREGIRIEQPPDRPWWETLKERLEGQAPARVAVPGQHAWKDVELRIAPAMQGEKLATHTTYNELQINIKGGSDTVGGLRGENRVFAWPIPLFPNFAIFVDTLAALKQPLLMPEKK